VDDARRGENLFKMRQDGSTLAPRDQCAQHKCIPVCASSGYHDVQYLIYRNVVPKSTYL